MSPLWQLSDLQESLTLMPMFIPYSNCSMDKWSTSEETVSETLGAEICKQSTGAESRPLVCQDIGGKGKFLALLVLGKVGSRATLWGISSQAVMQWDQFLWFLSFAFPTLPFISSLCQGKNQSWTVVKAGKNRSYSGPCNRGRDLNRELSSISNIAWANGNLEPMSRGRVSGWKITKRNHRGKGMKGLDERDSCQRPANVIR